MNGDGNEQNRRRDPNHFPTRHQRRRAIAEERAMQLVANITTQAQNELRGLRDQLDDLMREMTERRAMLTECDTRAR